MNKAEKIREEVEMVINRRLNLLNGDYFDLNKEVDGFTNEIMDIIDSLQEEPVSEDLEYASEKYACRFSSSKYGHDKVKDAFITGAQWQKKQIVLNDNNKEYHRVHSTTLKRLYMNETKYELLKSDIIEGIVGDFEKGTTHNYLTIKIPMLLCPSNCAKGDKVKLIIIKEE
jgi:hypothetical protein